MKGEFKKVKASHIGALEGMAVVIADCEGEEIAFPFDPDVAEYLFRKTYKIGLDHDQD